MFIIYILYLSKSFIKEIVSLCQTAFITSKEAGYLILNLLVQDEDKARLILKLLSENFYSNISRRRNNLKVQ